MRRFNLLIFLFFIGSAVTAQGKLWSYGANPYYGAVFKYKDNMDQIEFTNLHGVEFYANKQADGSKAWHRMYNYPQWGIGASYFNYGVPDELGEVAALTTYLDFTKGKKKHKWRINIGTGIVYSSVTYEPITNEDNTAVSSDISYVLRGTIHKEFQLSDSYYFNVNFAFRHFSNGRLNMPNNGMNFPVVGVGLRYVPHPVKVEKQDLEPIEIDKKWRFNLRGSVSWRQVWEIDEPQPAYAISAYMSKQVSRYNLLLVGVDAFQYDESSIFKSNVVYRQKNDLPNDFELDDGNRQLALTVGTELLISKATVIIQGGIYVYRPQEFYASWYQRYGLKYNFTENIFGQFSLKTHSRTADMIEFGLGFTI